MPHYFSHRDAQLVRVLAGSGSTYAQLAVDARVGLLVDKPPIDVDLVCRGTPVFGHEALRTSINAYRQAPNLLRGLT